MRRPPSPKLARRITFSLILLSAAMAICAIALHRMHGMVVDEAESLLAEAASVQALKAGYWLDEREAAFRLFAAEVRPEEVLDPANAKPLSARLRARDEAFTGLSVADAKGRILWSEGDAAPLHGDSRWFNEAAGPTQFAGGVYADMDGAPRVLFSHRLGQGDAAWHLRAEASPAMLAPSPDAELDAGWVLADGTGPILSLAGHVPGPVLRLELGTLITRSLPHAERLGSGQLAAAASLPGRNAIIAAFLPEPVTPYKNTGLALTIMAAVCLAYSGYVRARSLRG